MPISLVVVLGGLLIVVARHSTPSLAWDDGPVFWAGASQGPASIIEPYGGYFHPLARSIALMGWTLGEWRIGWIASILIALYVAGYVASDHMSPVLPQRWQRLAAGLAVMLLPGTVQTLGLLAQAEWYGEIFLLSYLVAGSANRVALAVFSLSGPFAVLFAPLVILRRPPGWLIVLAGGVIQGVASLVAPRTTAPELNELATALAGRGILGPFLGQFSLVGKPIAVTLVAFVVAGSLLAVVVATDRRLWPVFMGGAVVAVLGVLFAGETNAVLLAGAGARYSVALSFGLALYALRSPRSPVAWAIAGMLAFGVVGDFWIPTRAYGW